MRTKQNKSSIFLFILSDESNIMRSVVCRRRRNKANLKGSINFPGGNVANIINNVYICRRIARNTKMETKDKRVPKNARKDSLSVPSKTKIRY